MIHQTSYRARRIVGQLSPGEDIVGALTQLCQEESIEAGELHVMGALRSAELARFDPERKDYHVAHTCEAAEIVRLDGTVATIGGQVVLRLSALLTAAGPFGDQFIAGQVRDATAEACEFILEAFEDMRMVRGKDAKTGRTILSAIDHVRIATPAPAAASPAAPAAASDAQAPESEPAKMSWGEAIRASEEVSSRPTPSKPQTSIFDEPEEDPEEIYANVSDGPIEEMPEMKPGDVLDHPKLGRCRIMKVEDEEYAHIRLPRGKISKLVLEIFEIEYKGTDHGRNVFSLRMRKK